MCLFCQCDFHVMTSCVGFLACSVLLSSKAHTVVLGKQASEGLAAAAAVDLLQVCLKCLF